MFCHNPGINKVAPAHAFLPQTSLDEILRKTIGAFENGCWPSRCQFTICPLSPVISTYTPNRSYKSYFHGRSFPSAHFRFPAMRARNSFSVKPLFQKLRFRRLLAVEQIVCLRDRQIRQLAAVSGFTRDRSYRS